MAVLESNQTVSNNRNGFDKDIHKSARTMMLDNIQNFIYQRPIPSCVRETVSNCIDATNEKLVALKIIRGELDVSQVYKTLNDVEIAKEEDNIYADSEFKRDYYDPEWLSPINRISIEYRQNRVIGERDMFSITDNGVGIGDARLEGIFSLGFSTKRLNTNELGGFGIGQKSALATGVSSYRMITRHNGKEFKFDIFSHKVENVIGKWTEDGKESPFIEFHNTWVDHPEGLTHEVTHYDQEGKPYLVTEVKKVKYKAYYTPTTEKNGTTIEFEVKSHNRQAFVDAVKSQLMYLKDDIVFTFISSDGRSQNIDFKSKTVYEDDNIILSDYGHYNRPHFVIKGIAYGIIDFAEAELSPKFGNMGFKFKMEDLDVVPSRESVRYTPKTTEAIVKLYDKIKSTVEEMIKTELKQEEFLPWLEAANKITTRAGNGNSNDVLTRLSSLVDQSEYDLTYKDDIKYSSSFKSMFGPLFTLQHVSINYRREMKREDSDYTSALTKASFIQFEKSEARRTGYLLLNNPSISTIRINNNYRYLTSSFSDYVLGILKEPDFIKAAELAIDEDEVDDTKRKNVKAHLAKAIKMLKLLREKDAVKLYGSVIIPEDFVLSANATESEVSEALDAERHKQILRERRANREFYIQTYVLRSTWTSELKLARKLVKFTDMDQKKTDGCQLVYFTEDSKDELITFLSNFKITVRNKNTKDASGKTIVTRVNNNPLDNDKLLIFKVAKSNVKQVKPIAISLEEWFYNIDEDGTLKLASLVADILNAKNNYIRAANISLNESNLINQGFHEKVTKLGKLDRFTGSYVPNLTKVLDSIYEINSLALQIEEDYEAPELADKISKLNENGNLPSEVLKVEVLSPEVIQLSKECEDFERVYGKFLKHVDIKDIKEEIEIIMQSKKDQLQFKFKGLHDDINS